MSATTVGARGECAASPWQLPRKGWWQVLRRVYGRVTEDNLSVVSAGVGFYGFLSLFPALAASVLIYGIVADPATAGEQIAPLAGLLPADVFAILSDQLRSVTAARESALGIGLLVSLALAIWSATKGAKAVMTAMNIAYQEREERGIIRLNVVAIVLTICAILFLLVALLIIAAVPLALEALAGEANPVELAVIAASRWLVLALLTILGLGLLYSFGPHRRAARWQWVTPGAVLATLLWLAGSMLFSAYVTNFGNYNETFGSLGAVVVLLLWLYLSAYVVCLGAELNAEAEFQTLRDTTVGPARPAGARGAFVADHSFQDPETEGLCTTSSTSSE